MKNNILILVLAFFMTSFMYAQDVGDVFLIGHAKNNNYKHIDFPKSNTIIKKGGIASYKNIKGEKVVITSIKEEKNGKRVATIKLATPGKFFNSHKYIRVDIDKALENKELLKV